MPDHSKAIRVYEQVVTEMGESDTIYPEDPRRPQIIREIRWVVGVRTEEEAAEAIEFWGWDSRDQLMQYVKRIREIWRNDKV